MTRRCGSKSRLCEQFSRSVFDIYTVNVFLNINAAIVKNSECACVDELKFLSSLMHP